MSLRASIFQNRVAQACFLCGEDVPVGTGVALGKPELPVIAFHASCLHMVGAVALSPKVSVVEGPDGVWDTPENIRAKKDQVSYQPILPPRKRS